MFKTSQVGLKPLFVASVTTVVNLCSAAAVENVNSNVVQQVDSLDIKLKVWGFNRR